MACGHMLCPQGLSLSRESLSPTTQEERESSGMKRGDEESGVKRRNEREAAPTFKEGTRRR